MSEQHDAGVFAAGEVLALAQRSVRRRDYELRRGDEVVGWLRFPPGRRSVAGAGAEGIGPLALLATARGLEVRGDMDAATTIATVEQVRGGAVVRLAGGPVLRWHRAGGWHRWAIDGGGGTLLRFAARQGVVRSSVRITAHQEVPWPTAQLLSLVGGFLALRTLQSEQDGSAAVAGVVAAGAG